MAVVNGISQLESEDGVSTDLVKFGPQFGRSQTEVIEAVVPTNAIQDLEVATDQPVTRGQHHLMAKNYSKIRKGTHCFQMKKLITTTYA